MRAPVEPGGHLEDPTHHVSLRTLGAIGLERANDTIGDSLPRRRKPFALLVYLSLAKDAGAFHSRDSLCALLWPKSTQARSRSSLRQALVVISRTLGSVLERRGANELRMVPGLVSPDVRTFLAACADENWAAAVREYRGPFLDGFHVASAPAFERWQDSIQLSLVQSYKQALAGLASDRKGSTDPLQRSALWLELAELAPYDGRVARNLARALERTGSPREALESLRSYVATLSRETSLVPDPETVRALAEFSERARPNPLAQVLGAAMEVGGPRGHASVSPGQVEPVDPNVAGPRPVKPRLLGVHRSILVTIAVAALSLVSTGTWSGTAPEPTRVLVTPVRLLSAEPNATSHALALVLGEEVALVGAIEVVPYVSVLEMMGADDAIGPSEFGAVDLARTFHADVAVRATVLRSEGGVWEVVADVVDTKTGDPLGPTILTAGPSDDLSSLVRTAGQRVATLLVEQFAPAEAFEGLSGRWAVPPPLPAYTALADALTAFAARDYELAEEHAKLALLYAPDFTTAQIEVAVQAGNRGALKEADSIAREIRSSGKKLGALDGKNLAWLEAAIRGDRPARLATIRQSTHPRKYQLAWELHGLGRVRESNRILLASQGFASPASFKGRESWLRSVNYHILGEHEKELDEAHHYRTIAPGQHLGLRLEARALAATGHWDRLESMLADAKTQFPDQPLVPARVAQEIAQELAAHGWSAEAKSWFSRAVEQARAHQEEGGASLWYAQLLYSAGLWTEARSVFERLLIIDTRDLDVIGALAVIDARSGNREAALRALADLARPDPYDRGEHALWRARIAAALGRDPEVLPLLRLAISQGAAHPAWNHTLPEWQFFEDRTPIDAWFAVDQPM